MNVTLICPLYEAGICFERGCNGHLSRPQFEKIATNGDELYSGSCPRSWEMFHNLSACAAPIPQTVPPAEQKPQSETTKIRGKGVCEFSGHQVHPHIFIIPGKSIKVKTKLYSFDRASEWEIIKRFFRSYVDCEDHSKGNFQRLSQEMITIKHTVIAAYSSTLTSNGNLPPKELGISGLNHTHDSK